MLHIQAQALSLKKPKYRSFSNNSIAALHDTVIYGTNFKTEFADASTRFKFLKTKADELVRFNVSMQTVLRKKLTTTDDIKNMMELRNQVKLHQLREDDDRFEIILLTIKAYVSQNNAALFYDRKYLNWICIFSRQSSFALQLKDDDFLYGNRKHSRKLYFLQGNYVQVLSWYFTIHYKFLDVKILRWTTIPFDHRRSETSSATSLLASTSTDLSSKRFFSLLVSNLCYNKSAIKFPDAPWSGSAGVLTKRWNYLINMGGFVTGFLEELTKDQDKEFKQCLSKMENRDACSFYHMYEELCKKDRAYVIWLLPHCLYRRSQSSSSNQRLGGGHATHQRLGGGIALPDCLNRRGQSSSSNQRLSGAHTMNRRLGGGITSVCEYSTLYSMPRLFHSFITRDPAKLSQLHNPDAIMRVAILERGSVDDANQDNSEETFPAHLRAVYDQCEGFFSFSCFVSLSQQLNGQVYLLKDAVMDLRDEITQNEFINKMRNAEAIKKIAIREQASPNQSDQENYSAGSFLPHLRALHDACERSTSLSRSNSFSRPSNSGGRPVSRLQALEQAVGYSNVNSIEDNTFLNNPNSLLDYALYGFDMNQQVKERPEAVRGLLTLVHAISNAVRSNDIRLFDDTTQRCAVCNEIGHPFDSCPLLQNPDDMKQALIKLTTAWRKFQRVCEALGGRPREIADRSLNAINAVAAFDLSAPTTFPVNSVTPSPLHSVNPDPVIDNLTDAVISHQAMINSIDRRLRSALADNNDNDDDNSVSTDDNDESVRAANPIRQLSSRATSGRQSDFSFRPALNNSMRRPLEHRVQSSRSSSSNQHRFDPKLRGMGGVTERSQLKKYEKNRKCKIRNQYNKDLKKIYNRCKPTMEQQPISLDQKEEEADINVMSDEVKKIEKVYIKLLPGSNPKNGTSTVRRMAESAMMAKCISNSMFPSLNLKFSRGYSKAADHLQSKLLSPEHSIWNSTNWNPGDGPIIYSVDDHTSQARSIDYTGSIQNLQNQWLPTYVKDINNDRPDVVDKTRPIPLPETKYDACEMHDKVQARPTTELQINSNNIPIFGFVSVLNESSSQSSRCEHKDQLLELYENIDTETARIELSFDVIGNNVKKRTSFDNTSSDFFFSLLILTHRSYKILIQESSVDASKIGATTPSLGTRSRARKYDLKSPASVVKMLSKSQTSLGARSRARNYDQKSRAYDTKLVLIHQTTLGRDNVIKVAEAHHQNVVKVVEAHHQIKNHFLFCTPENDDVTLFDLKINDDNTRAFDTKLSFYETTLGRDNTDKFKDNAKLSFYETTLGRDNTDKFKDYVVKFEADTIKFKDYVVKFEIVNNNLNAFASNTVYTTDTSFSIRRYVRSFQFTHADASNSVNCIKTDHSFSFNPQDFHSHGLGGAERSKAYNFMEQQSDKSEKTVSEKKMINVTERAEAYQFTEQAERAEAYHFTEVIERICLLNIFLPSRDVSSTARNKIQSVMMAKYLSGIFLPSPHHKLTTMEKCISSSNLPSMNQKLIIDFNASTHHMQRRELSTYTKNNNGNYKLNEVIKALSTWLSEVNYDEFSISSRCPCSASEADTGAVIKQRRRVLIPSNIAATNTFTSSSVVNIIRDVIVPFNFLLACDPEQIAKDIFKDIGITIQFGAEKQDGMIPFEFLDSSKPLPSEMVSVPIPNSDFNALDASDAVVTERASKVASNDNAVEEENEKGAHNFDQIQLNQICYRFLCSPSDIIKKSLLIFKNLHNACGCWRHFSYISAEMGGGGSAKTFSSSNKTSYYDTGSAKISSSNGASYYNTGPLEVIISKTVSTSTLNSGSDTANNNVDNNVAASLSAFTVKDVTELKKDAKQFSDSSHCSSRTLDIVSALKLIDDHRSSHDCDKCPLKLIPSEMMSVIPRLLKSHGWDKDSSKSLPSEALSVPVSKFDATTKDESDDVDTENVCIDNMTQSETTKKKSSIACIILPVCLCHCQVLPRRG